MEKNYNHNQIEPEIIQKWEDSDIFHTKIDPNKKPYTIVLPPPNASGKMHVGNALMIAIEDLLIRWKRMKGFAALWLPGTDHAGFETQTTYEKILKKEGKSRFQFDRDTLYSLLMNFVLGNKSAIETQIKSMGASVDWKRYTFTLDPKSIDIVLGTFEKMVKDEMIYRDDYVVNYSFKWGTSFSDAEITMKEQSDPLYYIKYGPLTVATVRPETKFGDTALAVNPSDERYKKYIDTELECLGVLGMMKIKVIGDNYVDPSFGTGVLKVTPAHDKNDFEIGRRHNLEIKSVIGVDGKMTALAGKYAGLKVLECRKQIIEDLNTLGLIEKIDEEYTHTVPVDYRSGDYIEQLVLPNWYIKVQDLKKGALEAVKNGDLNIYPKWQEITYMRWVENMHDWAISRQIVWGIRIPAWYSTVDTPDIRVAFLKDGNHFNGRVDDLLKEHTFEDIEKGLQSLIAPKDAKYIISREKPGEGYLQETDTFDTWFSSGQWPLITTGYPDSEDHKYFYPTNVLETGWEIITRWVSRMVMFGIYATGEVPFKDVYLHGRVMAVDGKKMSKSLGNAINPEEYQEKYGTDALRMGLLSGTANGKDFSFPRDRIVAFRNFSNKLWNMARFINMMIEAMEGEGKKLRLFENEVDVLNIEGLQIEDKEILSKFIETVKTIDSNLDKYRFSDAADAIYQFVWHEVADIYIESVKHREDKVIAVSTLRYLFLDCLKVLHPFMPFVTEAIWSEMVHGKETPLLAGEQWPIL